MNISKSLTKSLIYKSTQFTWRRNKPEPCKRYVRVTHCIFDLDGAILDNHEVLDKGIQSVFKKHSLEYNTEWHDKIIGMTGKAMWQKVIRELNLKIDWKIMNSAYMDGVKSGLVNRPVKPGVERLLNHLYGCGVPMAMVTSLDKETMEASTKHITELLSKFEYVVCGDDWQVKESKPSLEIYLVTSKRFVGKPDPESCLVFEDSPMGIMAAKSACMQVVGIPCSPTTAYMLRHADEVLNSLTDFRPGKYGMPPFPEQITPIA